MPQHATARNDGLRRAATGTGATLALAAVAVSTTAGSAHAAETYTVRAGDTVSHIAVRTGTSVADIARANTLADASRIRIGQVLTIPRGTTSAPAAQTTAPTSAGSTYTVVAGDTVSRIARDHGTTVQAVVAANGLDSRAFIRIGQKLTIPGTTATPVSNTVSTVAPASAGSTYTVVAGDTVSRIARDHGTTVQAVVAANGLDSRAFIRIGQKLTIPGAGAGATAAAPTGEQLVPSTFLGRTYPDDVVAAANANKSTLLSTGTPSTAQIQARVVAAATAMGVDPALAQAVAYQESGFRHTAVSPANAIGVMQVIPSSGVWASEMVGRDLNLLDPDDNITAGVAILRSLLRTSPDLPTAIAGYYQGATSVKKYGMYADTRRYVANVQTLMARFR